MKFPIKIRPYVEVTDRDFVAGTWSDALWKVQPFRYMRHRDFKAIGARIINRLMSKSTILVAVHPEGDPIMGAICFERDTLITGSRLIVHFMYVPLVNRQGRVATRLLEAAGAKVGQDEITTTAWWPAIGYYLEKWRLKCLPFFLWGSDERGNESRPAVGNARHGRADRPGPQVGPGVRG